MKLKLLDFPSQPKHNGFVSCVAWNSSNELISCGDDHKLLLWKPDSINDPSVLIKIPEDLFITDIQFLPKGISHGSSVSAKGGRLEFVLLASNGNFQLCSKNGGVEKTVEAHRGAILAGKWSSDGSALATCGEDGEVKIWSKSGMLRQKFQLPFPVYCLAWGPSNEGEQNQQFVYTQNRELIIASTKATCAPIRWKAHEALILKVDWNSVNNLIVSGSEDKKYKVWDSYGRLIFTSQPQVHDYPITSVAWSPNGQLFAAGSFNTLKICDKNGPTLSLEKREMGSIFSISWSNDSTQLAGACAMGHVVFGDIVDRKLEWRSFEVTISGTREFIVTNLIQGTRVKKEIGDRIINAALGWDHLIVVTTSTLYIYNVTELGVKDHQMPFNEGFVPYIGMCKKYFAIVHSRGVSPYMYESGKLMKGSIDFKSLNVTANMITPSTISFSPDTICLKDFKNEKSMIFFYWDNINAQWIQIKSSDDSNLKKHQTEIGDQNASQDIVHLALDQNGNDRKVAFIDKNSDLWIRSVPKPSNSLGGKSGSTQKALNTSTIKLGTMVSSIAWNDSCNILVALQDAKYSIFVYPNVVFTDRDLLSTTILSVPLNDFGKNPLVVGFIGNQVLFRKSDGSVVGSSITPYAQVLHQFVQAGRWQDAEKLCNLISAEIHPEENKALWASLAAMAVGVRNLYTAQSAYAAIVQVDKVEALQEISSSKNSEAEMFLLQGNIAAAEERLLPGGGATATTLKPEQKERIVRAIEMNLELFRWQRALELAMRFDTSIELVISTRKRYLTYFGRVEEDKQFKNAMKKLGVKS